MTLEQLDNLVRIGKLKREPPDPGQVDGLIAKGVPATMINSTLSLFFLPTGSN